MFEPVFGASTLETLDERTFQAIADLVYEKAGIHLGPHKITLVSARIAKRLRKLGLRSYREYYERVLQDESGQELVEMLNVISTNVTQFFREPRHFEVLGDLLRRWADQGQTRFRLWCAACSTGEEPYSIAIAAQDALESPSDCRILATDISTRVVEVAREGTYEFRHVEKVPPETLMKYFERDGRDGRCYRVVPAIRRMVAFGRINLATPPFPLKGPLDVVFCRNVMIYFSNPVRKRLLDEMYRLLKPGGYLMVGHAESLSGMLSSFKSVEPSIYVKGSPA